ncbi:AlpA family transcriptional regulator [Photobacterium sp. DNB23_23_1]
MNSVRLIKLKEVIHLTALSRSNIYKKMSENSFPNSISLGERSVAWVEEEVIQWIEDRISSRTSFCDVDTDDIGYGCVPM